MNRGSFVQASGRPEMLGLRLASAAAWIMLALSAQGVLLPAFCSMAPGALDGRIWASVVVFNPPAALVSGWLLMVTAMMLPLLLTPVGHVRASVLRRRRPSAIASFVAGYIVVWCLAGLIVMPASIALRFTIGDQATLAITGLGALVWQMSPAKQRCLNRCHAVPPLSPFAGRAERDAVLYGVRRGLWCVGNCSPLMLFAASVSHAHFFAMVATALWVFGEQLERPVAPRWQWRAPRKFWRIARYNFLSALRSPMVPSERFE